MKARRVSKVSSTGHCNPTSCENERGIWGSFDLMLSCVGGTGSRGCESEREPADGLGGPGGSP